MYKIRCKVLSKEIRHDKNNLRDVAAVSTFEKFTKNAFIKENNYIKGVLTI